MLWLWNFFLDRRQFSYLLIGGLIAAGLFAVVEIPKENAPSIDIPYGIVTTSLPGASAENMEKLVTDKLEDQISNVNNLDTVTSDSGDGVSVIAVQFDSNADSNQSMQDLRDAVSKAQSDLPTDATTPEVKKVNFNDQPIMVVSISGDLPQTEFSSLGKTLSDDLKNIHGVSRVDVTGVPDRQINVIVNKAALDQYGLRLIDVTNAIAASNASLPAGNITMDGISYPVNFKGGLDTPEDIQNVAVGSTNGIPIYLRDVALISDGLAPATTYSRTSIANAPSEQAIGLYVYKQSGGDIQTISKQVKDELTHLQSSTLTGLHVSVAPSTDQGVQIGKQLGDLTKTGVETVLLVIAVLLLTIGWRESLVAALSIPLSFLIAFIGLYLTGNSLNFISLFSLILAVGILVDSGIVVTEAIHARTPLYDTTTEAARHALRDYAWPLIAGTMATVAVFAPLFFISGIIGKFIAGIPYTLIFVLMASIFVALGIVPIIATFFAKRQSNDFERKQEEYTHYATLWYKEKLRVLLENKRYQKIFLWSITGLFVVSFLLPFTGLVQAIFFPQSDEDFVYINITKPHGTTLEQTDLAAREVEEILYTYKGIDSFETTVGQSSSLSGDSSSGSNYANITVNLPSKRNKTSTQIVSELQQKVSVISDADVQVLQSSEGPSSGAPIQIQFKGNDLNALSVATDNAKQLLSTIPHVTNITTSTQNNGTELALSIDRAKAAAYGLNAQVVAQTLRTAVNGMKATSISQPGQDIDVVVRTNLNTAYTDPSNTNETTVDSIENLSIQGPNGPVLLGSVLSSDLEPSNATISHKDKLRIESVSAYPDSKTTAAAVVSAFQKKINQLNVPNDVTVSYGGENEDINTSFSEMFVALIAGLALMFMILVLSFNSFRYTGYLLMIVPLSLIGVLDGLALTGQPLSFPSMLGFIALGGVIINHAIIMMDSMIHHIHEEPHKPVIDVVLDSAATRLRPIFLTTVTTVIGMIPLAQSSAMWAPLAYTIMFGLTFAIVLTLLLVPVIFYRAQLKKKA